MRDTCYRASTRLCFLAIVGVWPGVQASASLSMGVICLDGTWQLAIDPENQDVDHQWFQIPPADVERTRVPSIIQDAFHGYHGVAWYRHDFLVPPNPHDRGRYLLRFWAVDYKADVWANGVPVGTHEGGETPFVLDVTTVAKPGATNQIAVPVVNPTHTPIDGLVLAEMPHRNKVIPYTAGSSYNHGGIVDSVELLVTPELYMEDLFVRPDLASGRIRVTLKVHNATENDLTADLSLTVAAGPTGPTENARSSTQSFSPGTTISETDLAVANHRQWELSEPRLYRVTTRVHDPHRQSFDEQAVRCGFRDFRFENGCFRATCCVT